MTVYVIRRNGDTSGLVKIGYTNNLQKRLDGMMTSAPEGFDVIHALEGGRSLEATLHSLFASKRQKREWFGLTPDDLEKIPSISVDEVHRKTERHIPSVADVGGNIVHETRFYLNELVRREWRGIGDDMETARNRVMAFIEYPASYGFRLWHKHSEMKDVSGEAYRRLQIAYCMKLYEEGALSDPFASMVYFFVKDYQRNPPPLGRNAFGDSFILSLIEQDWKPVSAGKGMAVPSVGKADRKKA